MRLYRGPMADSARWKRFPLRPDDIIITTPAKAGTTWMQTIVGMILFGRVDLGAPISMISPWLDMLTRSEDEVFALLAGQTHRRFIKTHTPLDGLPYHETITYIAVARHPLDIALSDHDHSRNQRDDRARELRSRAGVDVDHLPSREEGPDDPQAFLRWFIDNDIAPDGSGPHGLADYCNQIRSYWDARDRPNVHRFHYADLWSDLDAEMRRVAVALGMPADPDIWSDLVDAAGLSSMRARAGVTAPEAHVDLWHSPERFFRVGGTRDWAPLLDDADLSHFRDRMDTLLGDAAEWARAGSGTGLSS